MHIPILSYIPFAWFVNISAIVQLVSRINAQSIGLLQTLDDCGSPPLASRAPTLSRPTSLRTSDHKSMMAYLGLPLDIFGKVCICAFTICLSVTLPIGRLGRVLPTLLATTADGYAEGDKQLAVWEHQFDRDASE